mmetsp:Transcript_1684/g.2290  ORF Transcript_1684/g.2290 Transcript_1684/m.2290 type:complete len:90 (-) Transcript_1684:289-558(-)
MHEISLFEQHGRNTTCLLTEELCTSLDSAGKRKVLFCLHAFEKLETGFAKAKPFVQKTFVLHVHFWYIYELLVLAGSASAHPTSVAVLQ